MCFYFVYADSVTASLDFEIYSDGKALILLQLEQYQHLIYRDGKL